MSNNDDASQSAITPCVRVLLLLGAMVSGLGGCATTGRSHTDCTSASSDPLTASELQRIGEELVADGELLNARSCLTKSLALAGEQGDDALAGLDLLYLGELAYRLGDYSTAKAHMEAAQPLLLATGQNRLAVRNANNLGNTLSNLGQFQDARAMLGAALTQARALGDQNDIAQSQLNIGALHYNLRHYAAAMEVLEQADRHAKAARNARLQLSIANTKGAVLRQQGDFNAAWVEYERARSIGNRHKDELGYELGITERITAELLLYTPSGEPAQNLANAQRYLRDALSRHQGNPVEEGIDLSHLGEHALLIDDPDRAISYFEQAKRRFEAVNFPDGVGRSHINLGHAYNEQGRYLDALHEFTAADTVYAGLRDREWRRVALFGRGFAHEQRGELAEAVGDYKASIEQLESIRREVHGDQPAKELFTEVNAAVYERLVALLIARGDITGALEYIERSRLRALKEYLLQARGSTSPDTPLGIQRDRSTRAAMNLAQARRLRQDAARSAVTTDPEIRGLILEAARDFTDQAEKAELALDLGLESISMATLEELPPDVAVITFFPTPKATYTIVARGGQTLLGITNKELKKNELRRQVGAAVNYLLSGQDLLSGTHSEDIANDAALQVLYEALIAPLAEVLAGTKTLVIYPHDYLVYLPFEALRAPDTKRYLVQDKRLIYLHAILGHKNLNAIAQGHSGWYPRTAVVFANPLVPNRKSLPNAEQEGRAIRASFPDSKLFTGPKATEHAFRQHWGRYDIVHIAAHGEATPQRAMIYLASSDNPPLDGKLTKDDISGLPTNHRTRLVVLSACESALDLKLPFVEADDPVASLGLAGLVHVFAQYHRVQSRIGSLWQVSDASTAVLMGAMYKQMTPGSGTGPYDAFRAAQLGMIEERGSIAQHPYFWAGFVYFGVPR